MLLILNDSQPENIATLLKVLYDSKISYTVETTQTDESTIYEAIDKDLINPMWMTSPHFYTILKNIQILYNSEKLDIFMDDVEALTNKSLYDILMKPVSSFKEYIGTEGLNKDGLLSMNDAIRFIHTQIHMRNIKKDGKFVYANKWLKGILQTDSDIINLDDLPEIVRAFF